MRSIKLLGWAAAALMLLATADASAQTVLVWSTGGSTANAQAVAAWIQASNQFTSVTGIDQTNMTLAQLTAYDRLLFFTNGGGDPNNGNVLSSYANTGRRLVLATFSWANQGNNTLGGTIITSQQSPFVLQGSSLYTNVTMASNDSSQFFNGVTTLTGYYHDNVTLTPGAIQRGTWSDGEPLLAQKNNIIAVNLFPDDGYGNVSGNYQQLFINALIDGICGDGNVNAGEDCDTSGESATCDDDCTFPLCGDGNVNMSAGEQCDDMMETATCNSNCTTASCGDGIINVTAGEQCDDMMETANCNADCTTSVCGDGTLNTSDGEQCDDGNNTAGDGCGPTCLTEGATTSSTGSGSGSATSSGAGGAGSGATSGAGGTGLFAPSPDDDGKSSKSSGCGCRVAGDERGDLGALALSLLGLVGLLRRRRRQAGV